MNLYTLQKLWHPPLAASAILLSSLLTHSTEAMGLVATSTIWLDSLRGCLP